MLASPAHIMHIKLPCDLPIIISNHNAVALTCSARSSCHAESTSSKSQISSMLLHISCTTASRPSADMPATSTHQIPTQRVGVASRCCPHKSQASLPAGLCRSAHCSPDLAGQCRQLLWALPSARAGHSASARPGQSGVNTITLLSCSELSASHI